MRSFQINKVYSDVLGPLLKEATSTPSHYVLYKKVAQNMWVISFVLIEQTYLLVYFAFELFHDMLEFTISYTKNVF